MVRKLFLLLAATMMSVSCAGYRTLSQRDVIRLSHAGVGDEVILSRLETTETTFDLSAEEIIRLKEAGVSPKVLEAMVRSREGLHLAYGLPYSRYPSYYTGGFYPSLYYRPYWGGFWGFGSPFFWHPGFFRPYGFFGRPGFGRAGGRAPMQSRAMRYM